MERLERCTDQRMAPLGRRITELASRHSPVVQAKIQETLAHLAWLSDHGVLYAGQGAYEQLDKLWQRLIGGDVPLDMCERWCAARKVHVHRVLGQASLQAKGPPEDVRANAWSLAFARLVLSPDGSCDLSVLDIVLGFAESNDLSWLPDNAHREDFLIQLQQMAKAGPLLGDTLDRMSLMSATHPVPASVQATLRLRDFPGENDARRVLALHLWQTLLTAPLQGKVGNCWHVSHDRALHFQPMELLHHLSTYLDTGRLEFNGRASEKDRVAPAPYPTMIMQLAMDRTSWAEYEELKPELVLALQVALPGKRTDEEWRGLLDEHRTAVWNSCARGRVPIRVVLERLVASELGLPARYIDGVVLPIGVGHRKMLADYQKLSWTVLLAWEAQRVNPLATAWQSTVSKYAIEEMLMKRCWAPIELALWAALKEGKRPAGTDARWVKERMSQLKETFRSCATLHLDHDPSLPSGSFRLFVGSAGVDPSGGRGTPVRNVRELVALLEDVARQAPPVLAAHGGDKTKEWRSCVSLALQSPSFRAAVQGDSESVQEDSPKCVWLAKSGFGRRGDLGAVVRQDGRYHDHVHNPDGSIVTFGFSAGPTQYRVASSLDWRSDKPDERSLRHLLRKLKRLNGDLFPSFNLETYLDSAPGLVAWAKTKKGVHGFVMKPNHPSVRGGWKPGSPSPRNFIRAQLKQPMQRLLEQQLTPDEASVWLKKVLAGSRLNRDADIDALVAELLPSAIGGISPPAAYTLKSLVSTLDRLLARKKDNPFQSTDPQRNGLDVSILNELPGEVPWLVYAHTNWESCPHAAYGVNPRTGQIKHFIGTDLLRDDGKRRFQVHCFKSPYRW